MKWSTFSDKIRRGPEAQRKQSMVESLLSMYQTLITQIYWLGEMKFLDNVGLAQSILFTVYSFLPLNQFLLAMCTHFLLSLCPITSTALQYFHDTQYIIVYKKFNNGSSAGGSSISSDDNFLFGDLEYR